MRRLAARTSITGITAALLFALPAPAQIDDASYGPQGEVLDPTFGVDGAPEEAAETGAAYARLLYFEGGVSLRRAAGMGLPAAEVSFNAPVVPGDEIWTGVDGRAEIQLADGSMLRLGPNARLGVMNLADYAGAFDATTLLRLLNGNLHVRAADFDSRSRRFQIDTPSGSVFLLSEGVYRIDVTGSGVATVSSYRGVAELLGQDSSVIAHSGERMTASPGRLPAEARAFNTLLRDDFDVWVEGRDDAVASARSGRGPAPESVPSPVRPYVAELSYYGSWQDTPEYGWVWRPGSVDPDWRPYYYGGWTWAPIGMVWVSTEPWGYAPYHYGRWHWTAGLGWFWAPGYVYSGAYVSWAVGPTYYGWCPTGFYGYPVIYAGYGHHHYHHWTYVHHAHIYDHHVHKHYYSYSDIVRHRLHDQAYSMDGPPRANPRARPERVGSAIYRHAQARQGSAPRRIDPPAQNVSFRERDVREFRRRAATSAPAASRGNGAANVTRARATNGSPALRRSTTPPRAAAPSRTITPVAAGRPAAPRSGVVRGRSDTRPQISPVSGRTLPPAGRALPPARNPGTRRPDEGTAPPSRPSNQRMQPRQGTVGHGRIISAQPISTRAVPQRTQSGVVRTTPHTYSTSAGRSAVKSPFVMVNRGRGQAGTAAPRSAAKARPSRAGQSAAAPAHPAGKGGKGSGGKSSGGKKK